MIKKKMGEFHSNHPSAELVILLPLSILVAIFIGLFVNDIFANRSLTGWHWYQSGFLWILLPLAALEAVYYIFFSASATKKKTDAPISPTNTYNTTNIMNYIINSADYKKLMADIAELQSDLADQSLSQQRRAEKEQRLSQKIREMEELRQAVTALAETFNRIPFDSDRIRKAREHFENGRFKEADAVLNTEEIGKDVAALKKQEETQEEKLNEIRNSLAERAREYVLKARLRLVALDDPRRFDEAEALFKTALEASRAPDVLFDYAYYLQEQNQFSSSEPLYAEALASLCKLAEANPDVYLPDVATTLNNLAALHDDNNRHAEAEAEYNEALGIRRKLAQTDPDAYLPYVAMTLNNLAILHDENNRHAEAETEYNEALGIYRKLAQANPAAYLPNVALTLNNLAALHDENNRHAEAEAEYCPRRPITRSSRRTCPRTNSRV